MVRDNTSISLLWHTVSKLLLINWCEFLCNRLLDHSVNYCWNSKLTKLAFCFLGYLYPSNWIWLIFAVSYLLD